jgi:hypothetical protein
MTSIVEQLQRDSLDRTVHVSDLLRKAKVAAIKLGLNEAAGWVDAELSGYQATDKLPDYRELHGSPRYRDPHQGWIPIMFLEDTDAQDLISSRPVYQSIGEIEHLVDGDGQLTVEFEAGQISLLARTFKVEPYPMALFFGRNKIAGILDTVRNRVLTWALELEKAGIVGDGLSFSPKEKAAANDPNVVVNIGHIESMTGMIGAASGGSTITITALTPAQIDELKMLAGQIRGLSKGIGLTESQEGEFRAHMDAVDEELKKDQPAPGRIAGMLRSVRTIIEGAAGGLVATGVVGLIDKIVAAL